MRDPSVSVVMPVHNGGQFVADAVASIRAQTFEDFEFVIVDDGSTDETAGVLSDAARADTRIRVLTHAPRQGLRAALNRGLEAAHGRFIARQDADDLSHPDRLGRQREGMEARSLVLLGCDYDVTDMDGRPLGACRQAHSDTEIRWRMIAVTHCETRWGEIWAGLAPVRA